MQTKILAGLAAGALTVLAVAPAANATALALEFIQGGSTLTVLDNGAGDTNPTLGVIGIASGTTVGTYSIANAGAVGYPFVGSQLSPTIDINSLDVTNNGAPGTLRVLVSETDFKTAGLVSFSGQIGGTMTTQSLTYNVFWDQSNGLFVETTPIDSGLSFTTSPFAGTISANINTNPVYSLTEEVDVTGSGSSQLVSFDAQLIGQPVPEPASLALFGSALAGLGLFGRRRRKKVSK